MDSVQNTIQIAANTIPGEHLLPIMSAVQQGIGLSIVSSMAAEKAARSKLIKTIHLSDLDATRNLFLAKRKADASKKHIARDLCGGFSRFIASRRSLPPA